MRWNNLFTWNSSFLDLSSVEVDLKKKKKKKKKKNLKKEEKPNLKEEEEEEEQSTIQRRGITEEEEEEQSTIWRRGRRRTYANLESGETRVLKN